MTTATDESDLETLALRHYENFPVASRFLPKRYRRPLHLIYAFARTGDDIADESTDTPERRICALDAWSARLHAAVECGEGTPFFLGLAGVVREHALPLRLFDDLIEAFRMDVRHAGFPTYADLLVYCRHSANPVGRLMLGLFGDHDPAHGDLSDAFCTALQLANFWQDLFIDRAHGRFYIPLEDCERFGMTHDDVRQGTDRAQIRMLVRFEVDRTKMLFTAARPLLGTAPPALRFELKLIWHGGMRILERIERSGYNTLSHRPALGSYDKTIVLFRALTDG